MSAKAATTNPNLTLWSAVEKTPTDQTKKITGKPYQGTSPKPYYLVHKATETFGPCGIGWGFTILDERIEDGAGGERLSIARVRVWYEWDGKRGEVEHIGGTQFSGTRSTGKPFTDEDAPKKSVTDALVKALSMIGFAGDIFMGRYDDSKYVAELQHEEKANGHAPEADQRTAYIEHAKTIIEACQNPADLRAWWSEEKDRRRINGLKQADVDDLMAIMKGRIGALERPAPNLISAG